MPIAQEYQWSFSGLTVREINLPVPLDHTNPNGSALNLFARIYSQCPEQNLPYLVYLQGGPGFEAPRATDPAAPAWLKRAVKEFQVVMLDQRGTGQSQPIGTDAPLPEKAISGCRTLREASPEQQADYFKLFRADSIVQDAELLREYLGANKWSLLGQSFGGFTTLQYLSAAAESIELALFTGGLPALNTPLTQVYATTWENMAERSAKMWHRFPKAKQRYRQLVDLAADAKLRLPDGSTLGVERLRRIGMKLGRQRGQEQLHYLLSLDFNSPAFLHDLAASLPFTGRNPIYSIIHESCWADGVATNWAASEAMPKYVQEDPSFLAGEHIHADFFSEDPELAVFKTAAELLAKHEWPKLYKQQALQNAEVASAAAIYFGDCYVPLEYSLATAKVLPQLKPWVTSEYEHGGLGASGEVVFSHVLELAQGLRQA